MSFPFVAALTPKDVMTASTSKKHPLGTLGMLPDGRTYRYCKAGAAILRPEWGAYNANEHLTACTGESSEADCEPDAAVGDETVTILDTATRAVNYYADGYLVSFDVPGQIIGIVSSTAGAGTSVTLTLETPLTSVITGTCNIYPSPWGNIKSAYTYQNANWHPIMCVPPCAVANGSYFWGQIKGPCWITPNSWPMDAEYEHDLCFVTDGSIAPKATASAKQHAGRMISGGNYGDAFLMLELE